MRSQLSAPRDWPELAAHANYNVARLAQECRVCVRQLERFVRRTTGRCAREWLTDLRLHRALSLLNDGKSAKETGECVGYVHSSHFCRAFKRFFKITPNAAPLNNPLQMSQNGNTKSQNGNPSPSQPHIRDASMRWNEMAKES
jgi:AraC-like DNA-binding protein